MSQAPLKDKDAEDMASGLLRDATRMVRPLPSAPPSVDTIRALCHDLRQPLAAIVLLASSQGGDVRQRLNMILDQAQWLSDMVEGVIGDAADDRPVNVDVVDLVSHCVMRARPTSMSQIGFTGTGRTMAVAAPVALSRAVGCVLDNAVRAAGPGGQVTVEVGGTDSEITIRVTDDGPGLAKVPPNNSLGLTITRALVSACGGDFELTSGADGGAVAQIMLPATRSPANGALTLLVCDDHRPLLDALSTALTENGHVVVATAIDPESAVKAAERHQPDACLLDVNFPHSNGLTASDALGVIDRIHQVSPDTKVVLRSGSISRGLVADAIAHGAHGFVSREKPVDVIIEALELAHQGRLAVDL